MKRFVIIVDIDTDKSLEEIVRALTKGIYRGLDIEPNYVAPPSKVKINSIQEQEA
jgi:hypothetical protein